MARARLPSVGFKRSSPRRPRRGGDVNMMRLWMRNREPKAVEWTCLQLHLAMWSTRRAQAASCSFPAPHNCAGAWHCAVQCGVGPRGHLVYGLGLFQRMCHMMSTHMCMYGFQPLTGFSSHDVMRVPLPLLSSILSCPPPTQPPDDLMRSSPSPQLLVLASAGGRCFLGGNKNDCLEVGVVVQWVEHLPSTLDYLTPCNPGMVIVSR